MRVVGGERLGLATRAIEGEHQLRAQPLAKRMAADERLSSAEVRVDLQLELGSDPLLEHAEPQILEPANLLLGEVSSSMSARGRRARALARHEALSPVAALERAGLPHEPLETAEVDLGLVELERVSRRPRVQALRPEQLAKLRDRVLE